MKDGEEIRKIRTAAYCRVSTDSEDQESSYDAQCAHYTELIASNPEWILAGIYADEGISGTSTRNRTEFNRMISDCENGLIDMVITKSISRWSRNTVDCLKSIRKLQSLGIAICFEKESINTADGSGEMLITILSSLAQQESDSISRNVRMGVQYSMQQGKRRFNSTRLFGYNDDGSINPAGADVVRLIFRKYLEGNSPNKIAGQLSSEGILTATGRKTWNPTSILTILENEKYAGDFLMQKYYVKDFLTHTRVRNNGALPQYLITDDHDPIVPREVFSQVQDEIQWRAYHKYQPSVIRVRSGDALAGRLECGTCGKVLKQYIAPSVTDWRCMAWPKKVTRYQKGRCTYVGDQIVKEAIIKAFNELPDYKNRLILMAGRLEYELADVAEEKNAEDGADRDSLLSRAGLRRQLFRIHMLVELIDLMEERRSLYWEPEEKPWLPSCRDFDEFMIRTRYTPPEEILNVRGRIVEFDDAFVIRYLEKVTVNRDSFAVKFKAGLEVCVAADVCSRSQQQSLPDSHDT